MDLMNLFYEFTGYILGWPTILCVIGASLFCTVKLNFIQFRYFFKAWRSIFAPSTSVQTTDGKDMTPVQAFISALNSNLGNGTIAGVATAIYAGGPGAAFWMLAIGIILMSVRFVEVYLSLWYGAQQPKGSVVGGPMLYLSKVAGGSYLPLLYAGMCIVYGLAMGNAMQINTMTDGIVRATNFSPILVALFFLVIVAYAVFGGAKRVISLSEKIVPLKVIAFCLATLITLVYHYQAMVPALVLICKSAFTPLAVAGGALGFSVQMAMRMGISRVIFASETGLGTTAILFGSTNSKNPTQDAIMSMLSTFISAVIVFVMALCIVISGAWGNGLTGIALTTAAFSTVFGSFAHVVAIFLSVSFGFGAVVAYIYVAGEVWKYLTNGRWMTLFACIYCLVAFGGALATVDLVWKLADIFMGFMLFMNLYGILYLLKFIRKDVLAYMTRN